MTFEHSEYLDAPPDQVWAHLTAPGAMRRLVPAWSPLLPVREVSSLRAGTAVLGLPGPLTWHARHLPEGYVEGEQFVDEVVGEDWRSAPAGLLRWRHTHRVIAEGAGTRLLDSIDTPVPDRVLARLFRWRGETLRSDLAAQTRLRALGPLPRVVALTGAHGLVGAALAAYLGTAGVRVIRLVRRPAAGVDERAWRPEAPDPHLLDGVDAVVHLAGEPIAGRFTASHREAIRESRVTPTRRLAELTAASAALDGRPTVLVSASAIGFYGAQRPGEVLAEHSSAGHDFLAGVVADWERATAPAQRAGVRTVNVRTGIALSPAGGVLRLLRRVYRTGLGGRLGSGRQMMSWIDLDDLVDVYARALVDVDLQGPVNATAPRAVDGETFARAMGRATRRPALVPVPALGPRLLLGRQGADELALADQHVVPTILQDHDHVFRRPSLDASLGHQLGRS